MAAVLYPEDTVKAPIDRARFFAEVRKSGVAGPTLSQVEVDGLNGILDAWEQQGWPPMLDHVAYTMATARHEALLNASIEEHGRGAGKSYGKPAGPYGKIYYGRGPSQLTWLDNYRKMSPIVGVDLVKSPELACTPVIGAAILIVGSRDGMFRAGNKLSTFFSSTRNDPVGARNIINGDRDMVVKKQPDPKLTYGILIAGYHRSFLACLRAAELAPGRVPTEPVDVRPLPPPIAEVAKTAAPAGLDAPAASVPLPQQPAASPAPPAKPTTFLDRMRAAFGRNKGA